MFLLKEKITSGGWCITQYANTACSVRKPERGEEGGYYSVHEHNMLGTQTEGGNHVPFDRCLKRTGGWSLPRNQ